MLCSGSFSLKRLSQRFNKQTDIKLALTNERGEYVGKLILSVFFALQKDEGSSSNGNDNGISKGDGNGSSNGHSNGSDFGRGASNTLSTTAPSYVPLSPFSDTATATATAHVK